MSGLRAAEREEEREKEGGVVLFAGRTVAIVCF